MCQIEINSLQNMLGQDVQIIDLKLIFISRVALGHLLVPRQYFLALDLLDLMELHFQKEARQKQLLTIKFCKLITPTVYQLTLLRCLPVPRIKTSNFVIQVYDFFAENGCFGFLFNNFHEPGDEFFAQNMMIFELKFKI